VSERERKRERKREKERERVGERARESVCVCVCVCVCVSLCLWGFQVFSLTLAQTAPHSSFFTVHFADVEHEVQKEVKSQQPFSP
jgi:hypothetical protein